MQLVAFGGDMRMEGVCLAAQRAGWNALHVRERKQEIGEADAVLLPWPVSFVQEKLVGAETLTKTETLDLLPRCRILLHGRNVDERELGNAQRLLRPETDEEFQMQNACLTAEGAVLCAVRELGGALLSRTCVVTGFGRIGRQLAVRLCAMGMFVMVCVRSEAQMHAAHSLGAHPMPLAQLARAVSGADVVFNTIPARIWDEGTLAHLPKGTPVIELAGAPYGADPELARRMGVRLNIESGLPGRYAPMEAGAALFQTVLRALEAEKGEKRNG